MNLQEPIFQVLRLTGSYEIEGWARSPFKASYVELFVDDERVDACLADVSLAASAPPDGRSFGFRVKVPPQYRAHTETRRYRLEIDGIDVSDSIDIPALLGERSRGVASDRTAQIEYDAAAGVIRGWVGEPAHSWSRPDCQLLIDGVTAYRFQAGAFGEAPNYHGLEPGFEFALRAPGALSDRRQHALTLAVLEGREWIELAGMTVTGDAPRASHPIYRPPSKVLIVDAALIGRRGHVYNVATRLACGARILGIEPTIVGNIAFEPGAEDVEPVDPLLEASPYKRSTGLRGLGFDLDNINALGPAIQNDFEKLSETYDLSDTLVIFPTVNHFFLRSYSSWLLNRGDLEPGELHYVLLMLEAGVKLTSDGVDFVEPGQAVIYQSAFDRLARVECLRSQVMIGVISETLRECYQALSSVRLESASNLLGVERVRACEPSPDCQGPRFFEVLTNEEAADPDVLEPPVADSVFGTAPDDDSAVVEIGLYLGEVKADKGFFRLPGLLETFKPPAKMRLKLHVQTYTNSFSAEAVEGVDAALKAFAEREGAEVAVYRSFLSERAHSALLKRLDLIVLGYDPKRYAAKTSGVFWEAQSLGTPVIAPKNTWLEAEAERAGHPCVAYGLGDKAMAAALKAALTKLVGKPRKPSTTANGPRSFLQAVLDQAFDARRTSSLRPSQRSSRRLVRPRLRLEAQVTDSQVFVRGFGAAGMSQYNQPVAWMGARAELRLDVDRRAALPLRFYGEGAAQRMAFNALRLSCDGETLSFTVRVFNKVSWMLEAELPARNSRWHARTQLTFVTDCDAVGERWRSPVQDPDKLFHVSRVEVG